MQVLFSCETLAAIDTSYFKIISFTKEHIIIKSVNTGHTWKLKEIAGAIDIFHKHNDVDPFHYQTSLGFFEDCIDLIKGHDEFQLNGRRQLYPAYTRTGWCYGKRSYRKY